MPYSTDTRTLQPGDTYVAVRGDLHDGHDFVAEAVRKGAAGVVVERAVEVPGHVEVTRVEDSIAYLVAEASHKLRQSGARVVAITGSMGKTSVRAAATAVLSEAFGVVPSEGNKNTPLGLSLMLLNRDIDADSVLVLEMGARLPGDIRELCAAFPPTVSVVTVVRGVHLETLGTLDGIEQEKGEIVAALGPDGTACLNGDDPRVRRMAERTEARALFYGAGPDCDVTPDAITATLPVLGAHAVTTALAAFAVGRALGMDDDAINRGLEQIEPEKGRLNRLPGRGGSVLIDDTYNASPDAARAALDVLREQDGTRHVAVLGDMLELGEREVEEHVAVLEDAASLDAVFAVGEIMGRAVERLGPETRARVAHVPTSADLADVLDERLAPRAGDVVLVKGSQGARMERVSAALLAPDLDPADHLPRQSESWRQR
jgi:UDP-N-acetylmuramoyl-tripeptide--D-alanyl-D-alanine ligase